MLALILLLSLFTLARRYVSAPIAFLLTACPLISPLFAARLVVLRPHLLAIELAVLTCFFVMRRWTYATGVVCFIFALSYDRAYMPLLILGIAAFTGLVLERRLLRAPIAGILGIALGTIANPFFPQNVIGAFSTAGAVFTHYKMDPHKVPVEALPTTPMEYLTRYTFYLAFVILALALLSPKVRKKLSSTNTAPTYEFVTLTLIALVLWGMAALSRRSVEYALPLTVVLAAMVVANIRGKLFAPLTALAAIGLLLPGAIREYSDIIIIVRPETRWDAIGAIPAEASGKKVFNCEWYVAPFLLYKRPDLRFVDIGDPVGLERKFPQASLLRDRLRDGILPYPYGIARFAFGADYVLCESPAIISQLETDPAFNRLYPEKFIPKESRERGALFLYELAREPVSNEVMDFLASPLPPGPREIAREPSTVDTREWKAVEFGPSELKPSQRSPYIDLVRWMKYLGVYQEVSPASSLCAAIKPAPEEMSRHAGANLVGFGGGKEINLWWNGKLLFTADSPHPVPRRLEHLVALPRPLRAGDQMVAIVCAPGNAPHFGIGMSLWKNEELEKLCRVKAKDGDPKACLVPPESPASS